MKVNIELSFLMRIIPGRMNPSDFSSSRRRIVASQFGFFPSTALSLRACAAFLAAFVVTSGSAAVITQAAADASGQSSLIEGANWSDGLPPDVANDYVSGRAIRTPVTSGDTTFAGKSLTLNSGGAIQFKGTGTTSTITISQLALKGNAFVANYNGITTHFTLDGAITLDSTFSGGFLLNTGGNGGGFDVASSISGEGTLKVYSNGNSASQTQAITLSHANNTYSGGTLVNGTGTPVILNVTADGALGSGNVTVSNAKLFLSGGTANNYIGNSANLILSAGLVDSAISLDFTGADSLAGISLDGGTSYLAVGEYSVSQLNALYGSDAFAGSGSLLVVPEPGVAGMVFFGVAIGMIARPSRRG
jgi:hypothetical protein